MVNIFESLKRYSSSWKVEEERVFNSEELSYIAKAKVISSEYGSSVEITLKGVTGKSYIPLDTESALTEGMIVDMTKVVIKKLVKEGEPKPIYRILEIVD